ncbi:diiron oxygenase [Candidatus Neomicrothrix sp.]|jgi:predicted metal-dependent hydrolase|uniref:diiron oxygenase n=1 Tax=Candidatus Neomicrothrix sp. TaxID=2719034 RepID=UPI0025991562|nr:diiron oxygenase [Candidatus Microthrix sp.]HMS46456.1 diiron oxygenase [Candidatus Microthrix sp.]
MTAVVERVERLNRASLRRVIEPDADLPGSIGDGQLMADELLSIAGMDLDLTAEQRRILSREEVASMFSAGTRFEAVLEIGFARQVAYARDLTDPRITYLLHEIGEETRHQRLFIRLISQINPQAVHPLEGKAWMDRLDRFGTGWITNHLAMLYVMVLAGEEIPDQMQKLASEHPATDPFLASVNRYHRQEEARHLSFARTMLPEVWAGASRVERTVIRRIAPLVISDLFRFMVHPGVYSQVGLDPWATWKQVNKSPTRVQLRRVSTRPVLEALLNAGVLDRGDIPAGWQKLCGVNADGVPEPVLNGVGSLLAAE